MVRKPASGPIRSKERTKTKLLQAVSAILKEKGFMGLSVSSVAKNADVDRKLIYEYYGSLENLVKSYLNSKDYWRVSLNQVDVIVEKGKVDFGRQATHDLLENQFDYLMKNEEMRRIITWGLSENIAILNDLSNDREVVAEELFSRMVDKYFIGREKNMRAISAILVSGIYYLTLNAKMSGNTMCGIDINTEQGQAEIKKALKQIVDWSNL